MSKPIAGSSAATMATVLTGDLSMSCSVVASSSQISSELAGEAIILNLNSGKYYGLDRVGAFIWKLAQSPAKVSSIKEAILEEYEVEPLRCEQDLIALLLDLASNQLITVTRE